VDISTSLQITPRGEEEVKRRTYKLNLKKRSLLLLLEKPQPIRYIVAKSLFPAAEVMEEIRALITGQFVAISMDGMRPAAATAPGASAPTADNRLQLESGFIISEAKFLLIDFCVDNFGTQSQGFVDEIGACSKEQALGFCLAKVFAAAQKQCPDRLPLLLDVVRTINDTA